MNFYFEKIILWFHKGDKRELKFQPNKVNVITGGSNTGKSAILQIIDYCLFASHSKISESIINENVSWYGIKININNKKYTICRSSLFEGKVTYDYYFSSSGSVPKIPEINSDEKTIKSLLETEFGIDRNVRIPFGGQLLKPGSKISLRYFLLFTTISEDIITNSSVYFDKQNEPRYREALPRIFDLAVGIDNIENVLGKEKKNRLESEIKKLERMQNKISSNKDDFLKDLEDIIKRSKEFGLIAADLSIEDATAELKRVVLEFSSTLADTPSDLYNRLKNQEYSSNRIIRNLKRLQNEYDDYKKTLKDVEDSLKPIKFIHTKKAELVKTSIYDEIIKALETDYESLKGDSLKRTPIDTNVDDLIHEHEQNLLTLKKELATLPQEATSFNNDKEKHFFMGEIKTKLALYTKQPQSNISEIQSSLESLQDQLSTFTFVDISEKRGMFIKLLEEVIQQYIVFAGNVLENYQNYLPVFDYSKKILLLRKPFTDFIENVGSSSNHMFLHLFLFLGLHETIQIKKAFYVPSYLIIDQPSRPYWGEGKIKKEKLDRGDESKVRKAFELLDYFVGRMVNDIQEPFQIIVFEHVPPSTWVNLNHVHLVDEFVNGNALVQKNNIK
nr:DUF3732 domain-containing protein [uncultured Desulfobacter sp.]